MNHEGPGTRLTARSTKSKDTNLSYKLHVDFFRYCLFDFQCAFEHITVYLVCFFYIQNISVISYLLVHVCNCLDIRYYN